MRRRIREAKVRSTDVDLMREGELGRCGKDGTLTG